MQGLEALAMHPHVSAVLLDVIMPRLNGIEMLKQMSEAGLTAKLPVFLITADAADDTMREGLCDGRNGCDCKAGCALCGAPAR